MTVRVRPKDRHLRRLIDVWRKVCAPVRGKAKRPSDSAKCRLPDIWTRIEVASRTTTPRYRRSHWLVLGVPLGSFLAVSTMADEVRFAPVNGHPRRDSSLPNAISNRKARSSDRAQVGGFNSPVIQPAETIFIGSLATVFVKLWSHCLHSSVRSSRPFGPGTIPTSIVRQVDGTPLFNFAHSRKFEAAVAQPLVTDSSKPACDASFRANPEVVSA